MPEEETAPEVLGCLEMEMRDILLFPFRFAFALLQLLIVFLGWILFGPGTIHVRQK